MHKPLKRWSLATACIAAVVFSVAGTWRDGWLWAFTLVWSATTLYAMLSVDEDLIKERFHPPTSGADPIALGLIRIVALALVLVGAADVGRWHVAPVPPGLRAFALVAMPLMFGLFYRAMRENHFFSAVVRVQQERGHRVVDTGPYGIVRHPGYAGMILGAPFSGLALGSWLAGAIGLLLSAMILRRVFFEDAFLCAHLDGYVAYTSRVRHRLIPGVW